MFATCSFQVCALPHPIYKITATQLITHENVKKTVNDLRYVLAIQCRRLAAALTCGLRKKCRGGENVHGPWATLG